MNSCKFIITDSTGKPHVFESEAALDDFFYNNVNYIKKKGFTNDIVFSRSPDALRTRNILLEQKEKAKDLKETFLKAKRNAINLDSDLALNPDPPFIGVTKFLIGRRNAEGNLLMPEFREKTYWADRISHWTNPIRNGESIQDMFNEWEIRLLADGNTLDEKYQNFLNQRSQGGTYKPLTRQEAQNLRKAIETKWKIVNTEGTAIHFVMQQFFSELTDKYGAPISKDGKTLHVFDLINTPQDGFPSIQDYIMDKIKTDLKSEMGNKYSDNLITPQLLDQLIHYGHDLLTQIQTLIPGDLEFFPELQITGDLHEVSSGPSKLLGILDLVVVDQFGTPHIFDYKCSDKKYSEFYKAKQRSFWYQQAIYERLLRQHGLNTTRSNIRIAPITLNNLHCENVEETLTNPDNIQFAFDGIYYPPNSDMIEDIRQNIYGVSSQGKSPIIDNIDEFLPEEKIEDATTNGAFSFVTNMMGKFFPDYTYNGEEQDIRQEVEDAGGFEKADDNLYHFKINSYKDITAKDPEELVEEVKKYRKRQRERKPQMAETVITALQYAIENNTKDITDIIKHIDTRYLEDDKALQGWFKNYLQRYCNKDWRIIPSETAKQFGCILLRNNWTNQIDIIKLSTSNLKNIRNIKGNNNTFLTRAFQQDVVETSNNRSRMLQDAEGNRELIETLLMINTMPTIFSGTYNNAVVGNIEVINPYKGEGLTASNEEILYSYNKLKNFSPIEGAQDNITNGNIKLAPKWELFKRELDEALNDNSSYKLSSQEYFQKCQNEIENILTGDNVETKIRALLKVIKGLEDTYQIKQLSANQLNSETDLSPVYRLYYNSLITLGELRGLKFRQQLKESAKWVEGGARNILVKGLNGIWIDNPGNLTSQTLNSITELHKIALQNVRRDVTQNTSKIRNLVQKLKKEKNFGYITSSVKNDIDLYKNLYEVTSDGDFRFKFVDSPSLSATEKELLKYALYIINRNRFPTYTDEQLAAREAGNDISYYRVPLCRANRTDQRDAPIKKKAGENGELEDYQKSYLNSLVDNLKQLNPKVALQDLRDNIYGIFTEDDSDYKDAAKLFDLTTIFDATEPDASGNNLQNRLDAIATRGTGYFEQNLENLLFKHMVAYSTKKRIDEIMPEIKSGMAYLINLGESQNTNFENDVEYYQNYIQNKIKNQPIDEDPILGSGEKSQKVRAVTGKIKSAASLVALGFSPIQWFGQRLDGLWKDIQFIIRKPDGTNAFTLKNMISAYKEVNKDLFHYSDKPTKCQLINELYGINDMDMNQYADKLRTDKHGLFNLNELAYKFTSRPDFYNRMTIIVAQMKAQGVWDALDVVDGRLVYNYKKDKRFEAYANDRKDDPKYDEQRALYLAIAQQFVEEGTSNPDGTLFQIGQDLPAAYTSKEMESMKSLCDLTYGYYTNENKSMIHSTFLGGLWMQMKTYWSGKKNQYLNSGGVRLLGHWEQLKNDNGEPLYYQTDDDGNILLEEPPVPQNQVNNQQMLIPFTQWKGQWQEGIILSVSNAVRAVYSDEDVDWYNPLTWLKGYNKYIDTLDPGMRATYRNNIRQLWLDLLGALIVGALIGGLLADKDKDLIKEAKDSGNLSDAAFASIFNIGTKSIAYSADDFNAFKSITGPVLDWNPYAATQITTLIGKVSNAIFGDKSAFQNITNSFAATKAISPVMTYIAPDGGYIFPPNKDE